MAALIKDDPFSGVVYVFRAKRADRMKLPYWDGTGVVVTAKALEQGVFRWPKVQDSAMRLTAGQLTTLLDGNGERRAAGHNPRPAPGAGDAPARRALCRPLRRRG